MNELKGILIASIVTIVILELLDILLDKIAQFISYCVNMKKSDILSIIHTIILFITICFLVKY